MSANTGFTIDQCRKMAEDARDARNSGSLRPMAEFDPERILWLIEQVDQDKRRMDWLEINKDDLMFSWVQGTTVRAVIDEIISDVQDAVTQPAKQ